MTKLPTRIHAGFVTTHFVINLQNVISITKCIVTTWNVIKSYATRFVINLQNVIIFVP